MTIPHWSTDPEAWDQVRLTMRPPVLRGKDAANPALVAWVSEIAALQSQIILPGVWEVTQTRKPDIDVQKAKGKHGARIVDHGDLPTELELVGRISGAGDWTRMLSILPLLTPPKGGTFRLAADIVHPQAQFAGVSTIWCLPPELSHPNQENGIAEIRINAIEWFPEPVKVEKGRKVATVPASTAHDVPTAVITGRSQREHSVKSDDVST